MKKWLGFSKNTKTARELIWLFVKSVQFPSFLLTFSRGRIIPTTSWALTNIIPGFSCWRIILNVWWLIWRGIACLGMQSGNEHLSVSPEEAFQFSHPESSKSLRIFSVQNGQWQTAVSFHLLWWFMMNDTHSIFFINTLPFSNHLIHF